MKLNKVIITLMLLQALSIQAMYEEGFGYDWYDEPASPTSEYSDDEYQEASSQKQKPAYVVPEYDHVGRHAIHVAALSGNKDKIIELLNQGVDPNMIDHKTDDETIDYQASTPLMYAVSGAFQPRQTEEQRQHNYSSYIDVIKLLIDAGADLSQKNLAGKTAYDIAIQQLEPNPRRTTEMEVPEQFQADVLKELSVKKAL
jgi:hypothetical protein